MADESVIIELASIQRDYPGWRPWLSDGGGWWASRIDRVLPGDPRSMTEFGKTAGQLRDALEQQEQLALGNAAGIGGHSAHHL